MHSSLQWIHYLRPLFSVVEASGKWIFNSCGDLIIGLAFRVGRVRVPVADSVMDTFLVFGHPPYGCPDEGYGRKFGVRSVFHPSLWHPKSVHLPTLTP